jgi:hypothetical protein
MEVVIYHRQRLCPDAGVPALTAPTNGTVLVDTNHPLAGMTLEFEVTVVAVRDGPATGGCGNGVGTKG